MKKLFTSLSLVILIFVSTVSLVKAAPENNPLFATMAYVDEKIAQEIDGLRGYIDQQVGLLAEDISDLADNLDSVELLAEQNESDIDTLGEKVDSNTERIEGFDNSLTMGEDLPILPNAPDFKEITFMNWYIPGSGVRTNAKDVTYYRYMWFAYKCGNPAEMRIEYNLGGVGDGWYVQHWINPEQCAEGGKVSLLTKGRFYRVIVGDSGLPENNMVVAQGRFYGYDMN